MTANQELKDGGMNEETVVEAAAEAEVVIEESEVTATTAAEPPVDPEFERTLSGFEIAAAQQDSHNQPKTKKTGMARFSWIIIVLVAALCIYLSANRYYDPESGENSQPEPQSSGAVSQSWQAV